MGRIIEDNKPTWIGVGITVIAMLLTFALTAGSDRNQIGTNKEDIKELQLKNDVYYQNQLQLMKDIGEIKGYIGAQKNDK